MLKYSLVAFAMLAAPAAAVETNASNEMPFSFSIVDVENVERSGYAATVLSLETANGPDYVNSVSISCEAEADGEYTWDMKDTFPGLNPDQVRVNKIMTETEPPWINPVSVRCRVSGFEGGLW